MQKNLVMSKKSSTFALAFEKRADLRAFSSAGLEHLPYKQRVCGSNLESVNAHNKRTPRKVSFFVVEGTTAFSPQSGLGSPPLRSVDYCSKLQFSNP